MTKIIGIDLGTTNSVVAVYDPTIDKANVIEYEEMHQMRALVPSVVGYKGNRVLVGTEAKKT